MEHSALKNYINASPSSLWLELWCIHLLLENWKNHYQERAETQINRLKGQVAFRMYSLHPLKHVSFDVLQIPNLFLKVVTFKLHIKASHQSIIIFQRCSKHFYFQNKNNDKEIYIIKNWSFIVSKWNMVSDIQKNKLRHVKWVSDFTCKWQHSFKHILPKHTHLHNIYQIFRKIMA